MRLCFLLTAALITGLVSAQGFPDQFLGHWQGELEWHTGNKKQKIKMQLVIRPSDTTGQYTWQIIYGNKNEDSRPYILKPIDTAKGHWVIDERDGIVLDQYWMGNQLNGAFTVQNTTVINSYRIECDRLMVEFLSISARPVHKTGGTGDEVPPVASYSVKSFKKEVLRKVDNLKA